MISLINRKKPTAVLLKRCKDDIFWILKEYNKSLIWKTFKQKRQFGVHMPLTWDSIFGMKWHYHTCHEFPFLEWNNITIFVMRFHFWNGIKFCARYKLEATALHTSDNFHFQNILNVFHSFWFWYCYYSLDRIALNFQTN